MKMYHCINSLNFAQLKRITLTTCKLHLSNMFMQAFKNFNFLKISTKIPHGVRLKCSRNFSNRLSLSAATYFLNVLCAINKAWGLNWPPSRGTQKFILSTWLSVLLEQSGQLRSFPPRKTLAPLLEITTIDISLSLGLYSTPHLCLWLRLLRISCSDSRKF